MSHTRMHPAELREAADNPREIRPERFEALKYAMRADPSMMEARPVIVDARPGRGDVVCGNMRLRVALEESWDDVPVYLKEFESDAQRREWMTRDNNGYGDWVPDELASLIELHHREGGDLALMGFADQELSDLRALASAEPNGDGGGDAPEDPLPEVWGIVIDCDSADQQAELLEEFSQRGLKPRALMV